MITPAGQVSTVAGAGNPGSVDGNAENAMFDTPCGIAVLPDGSLIVADTGNNRLRKITPERQVTTFPLVFADASTELRRPIGLAVTPDGFFYVTELDRSRIIQVSPEGAARVLAGGGSGYDDGNDPHFNQPTGVAIDHNGDLFVADSANFLVRKLSQAAKVEIIEAAAAKGGGVEEPLPRLDTSTFGDFIWPLDPQRSPHEVAATMGEVRGRFNSTDSRDHLHSGLDVFAGYGDVVRAIRSEKVVSPLPNWAPGDINEGVRVGLVSYIHIQVGRDKDGKAFQDPRFIESPADTTAVRGVRIRRGTRFRQGEAIGTVNRMYHVHLTVGPPGGEFNPLSLSPVGFKDTVAPVIEKDGIQLFDQSGARLQEKRAGRLVVHGRVRIVVDAFDRTDMNAERRRLGLYKVGYQVLKNDGSPAPGFEKPRMNIEFNRLPWNSDAVKIAYADQSGITAYGSVTTKFLYEVTNTLRDSHAAPGTWDVDQLPKSEYILRVIAADYSGNEAHSDLLVVVTSN
jgi:hypothetical protein